MALSPREKAVLDFIVRDYIRHAVPVSSSRVAKRARLDAGSATIRTIMGDLEDAGYLAQPHTSAGRLPTQKGYRFYVDECTQEEDNIGTPHANVKQTLSGDPKTIVQFLVGRTHLFGCYVGALERERVQLGVGEVLQYPEFADRQLLCDFGNLIDDLDSLHNSYRLLLHSSESFPAVFIEKENPVPEARAFSVVASLQEDESLVFLIGPSRMDYKIAIRTVRDAIDHFTTYA